MDTSSTAPREAHTFTFNGRGNVLSFHRNYSVIISRDLVPSQSPRAQSFNVSRINATSFNPVSSKNLLGDLQYVWPVTHERYNQVFDARSRSNGNVGITRTNFSVGANGAHSWTDGVTIALNAICSGLNPWFFDYTETHLYWSCGAITSPPGLNGGSLWRCELPACAAPEGLLVLLRPRVIGGLVVVNQTIFFMVNNFATTPPTYEIRRRKADESTDVFAQIDCTNCTGQDYILRLRHFSDGHLYALATYFNSSENVIQTELIWRITSGGQVDLIQIEGLNDTLAFRRTDFLFLDPSDLLSVPVPTVNLPEFPARVFDARNDPEVPLNPPASGVPSSSPFQAPLLPPTQTDPEVSQPSSFLQAPALTLSPSEDAGTISGGAIAGIVIVVLALLAGCSIAAFFLWGREQKRRRRELERESRSAVRARGSTMGEEEMREQEEIVGQHYAPLSGAESITDKRSSGSGERRRADSVTSQIKRWAIDYNDLEFGDKIGGGNFGVVFEGEWRGAPVAIKQTRSSNVNVEEFRAEAALMSALRPHRNVTQIYGVCEHDGDLFLIMELLFGGSLEEHLASSQLDDNEKIEIVAGIASGISHIHAEKILHRDVAARNVLISENGDPKISDFGMSKKGANMENDQQIVSLQGPIRWMAPESIRSHKYSTKTDVFSFGILVWEIITNGQLPHSEIASLQELAMKRRDECLVPEIPSSAPPLLAEICRKCWVMDPKERPSMKVILKMIQQHGRRARKKSSHRRTLQARPEPSQSSSSLTGETNGSGGIDLRIVLPSSSSTDPLTPAEYAPPPVSIRRQRSSSKDSKSSEGKNRSASKETRSRTDSVSSRKSNKETRARAGSVSSRRYQPPEQRGRTRKGSVSSVVSAGSQKSSGSRKRNSKEDTNHV